MLAQRRAIKADVSRSGNSPQDEPVTRTDHTSHIMIAVVARCHNTVDQGRTKPNRITYLHTFAGEQLEEFSAMARGHWEGRGV